MKKQMGSIFRQFISLLCAVLIVESQVAIFAQALPPEMRISQQSEAPIPVPQADSSAPIPVPPAEAAGQPVNLLAPAQLDSLVAPLALYPDPLLSQVLVASTYPLEIVEAEQWMQENPNLTGAERESAAKQQNWDPSIQALTAFPDVLKEMSGNVQWTTQLGNAFLAQQSGVMDAVQRLRGQAASNGKLKTTPQEVVTTQTEGNASVIEIQPANPQVIYVPTYDPMAIWGPAFYPYPMMGYPYYSYIGFGAGIMVGAFFGGWGGWFGWGWHPNWFGHSIFLNGGFFGRYGYGYGRGLVAGGVWAHDPAHRLGVPYPNRQLANRFHASGSAALRSSSIARPQAAAVARSLAARSSAARSFASSGAARSANAYRGSNSYNSRSYANNSRSYANSSRSYANSAPRATAPSQNYRSNSGGSRAPAPAQHYSAPSYRGGGSMGRSSGGRSSGGGHGRR